MNSNADPTVAVCIGCGETHPSMGARFNCLETHLAETRRKLRALAEAHVESKKPRA